MSSLLLRAARTSVDALAIAISLNMSLASYPARPSFTKSVSERTTGSGTGDTFHLERSGLRRGRDVAKISEDEKERRALARRTKSALAAEADAHRQEAKRQRWAKEGTRLTRAELEAGVCCRGCGLPIIDELGDSPPLMLLTDEERTERENVNRAFASRHPDCKSIRWSMSGSRTTHCGECCPPPPLGDQQIEAFARLLRSVLDINPVELDAWRLTLTCAHRVERAVHRTNRSWTSLTSHCPECRQTRGIVTSEKLPHSFQRRAAERARLDHEIEQTTHELARHEKKIAPIRRRLDALETERRSHDDWDSSGRCDARVGHHPQRAIDEDP